ncbi:MAG: hypothetical protein GXP45_06710 [bacterium]|nr:hypothetical protein [bacterium]
MGLLVFILIFFWKQHKMRTFLETFPIKKFLRAFIITLIVVLFVSLLFTHSGITNTLLSIRYTFSGFFIFLLFFALGRTFFGKEKDQIILRYVKIVKSLLLLGIMRWAIIWIVPKLPTFFGYNMGSFEGQVGAKPPVTYYTQLNHGFIRNQFIFERPISRGFFLIALRPLFFVYMLKNK